MHQQDEEDYAIGDDDGEEDGYDDNDLEEDVHEDGDSEEDGLEDDDLEGDDSNPLPFDPNDLEFLQGDSLMGEGLIDLDALVDRMGGVDHTGLFPNEFDVPAFTPNSPTRDLQVLNTTFHFNPSAGDGSAQGPSGLNAQEAATVAMNDIAGGSASQAIADHASYDNTIGVTPHASGILHPNFPAINSTTETAFFDLPQDTQGTPPTQFTTTACVEPPRGPDLDVFDPSQTERAAQSTYPRARGYHPYLRKPEPGGQPSGPSVPSSTSTVGQWNPQRGGGRVPNAYTHYSGPLHMPHPPPPTSNYVYSPHLPATGPEETFPNRSLGSTSYTLPIGIPQSMHQTTAPQQLPLDQRPSSSGRTTARDVSQPTPGHPVAGGRKRVAPGRGCSSRLLGPGTGSVAPRPLALKAGASTTEKRKGKALRLKLPYLGEASALLNLAHVVHRGAKDDETTYDRGSPAPSGRESESDNDQSSSLTPYNPHTIVCLHKKCLTRIFLRGYLVGGACTYNCIEFASNFILKFPPARLYPSLNSAYIHYWGQFNQTDLEVRSYDASNAVFNLLRKNRTVRKSISEEKTRLGDSLERLFCFGFDVVLTLKDSVLYRLRQGDGTGAKLVKDINSIGTGHLYAHSVEIVPYLDEPVPITSQLHHQTDDFSIPNSLSDMRKAQAYYQRYTAYVKLKSKSRPGFVPSPAEADILQNPPAHRVVNGHDCVAMPGGHRETYEMDFQSPGMFQTLRKFLEDLHENHEPGEQSIVEAFHAEQKEVEPFSSNDLVWRVVLIPTALLVAALYAARENPEDFLNRVPGREVLNKTPKAIIVYQAKLLQVEQVFQRWLPTRPPAYLVLRERIQAIMEDVIKGSDPYEIHDLTSASWSSGSVDHLAYNQSFLSRDHVQNNFKVPLDTRAPTLLEASCIFSSRDSRSLHNLFRTFINAAKGE